MEIRLRATLPSLGSQQPEVDGPQIEVGWSDEFSPGVSSVYLNIRSYRRATEPPLGSVNLRVSFDGGTGETSLSGAQDVQNWHTYKIEWTAATATLYLDGAWLTTETANVPTGVSLPFRLRVTSRSNFSVSVNVDRVTLVEP